MSKTSIFVVRSVTLLIFITASIFFSLDFEKNKTLLADFFFPLVDNLVFKILAYFILGMAVNFLIVPMGVFYKLLGGYLFGWSVGFALSLLFTVLASYLSFRFSKKFFALKTFKVDLALVEKIDKKLKVHPILATIQFRLFPFFPLQVTNYVLSNLTLNHRDFLIGSAIGMAPASIVYAFIGNQLKTEIVGNLQFSLLLGVYLGLLVLLTLTFLYSNRKSKISNDKN